MPNMTREILEKNNLFSQQVEEVIRYWDHVPSILKHPHNDRDYKKLVSLLDALLYSSGGNEKHKLAGLIDVISDLISIYEEEHYPAPK